MFNQSQIEAISHKEGPALVLAGPGSGKTTVITHRIKKLIEQGVSPEKIMVVTFTKAAAVHMQKKFFHIMNGEKWVQGSYPVTFGTFHSIYYKILKLSCGYRGDNILTALIQNDIIREIILRKNIDVGNVNEFIQNILGEIGRVKGNMISLSEYEPKCCRKEIFAPIYEDYEKELRAEGKIDFDDMLLKCYELFYERPSLLQEWQENFSYILIDEFQDINTIQYEVIKMLAKPQNNLFIVGDDDQSIYGFRGACPEIMAKFRKDYPDAKKFIMNINYRSTPQIVKASENLIRNNHERFEKEIVSGRENGVDVDVRQFKNQTEELGYVAKKISEYIKKGVKEENIAILVRNNGQIPIIQEYLKNMQLETKSSKVQKSLYKGKVAEDVISYAKAALTYKEVSIRENEALVRILNCPKRYISRQVIGRKGMRFEELKRVYAYSREVLENIKQLQFHLDMIAKLNPKAAFIYIRNGVGYERYLRQYATENKINFASLIKQFEDISREAERYQTIQEWLFAIENEDSKEEKNKQGIHIMTMHSSKGLEFDVVFILDANQGIVPTSKAVREKEFEEERRVFYVAVTRAAKVLCVYGIAERLGCSVEMSMFAGELIR